MQSIFTDVGKLSLQDPAHSALIPSSAGTTASPGTSFAWLSYHGDAHFALASPAGGITVVTLPPPDSQGNVSVLELKRSSVMQRLSGWMPTAIRGEHSPADLVLSLAVRELEEDSFIFALCQDHRLRMWSLREHGCLLEADMLEYMPASKGVKRLPGHGHRLRLAFSSTTGLCVCVYLAVPQRGQFTVLQLVATDNNRYSLEHISTLFSTQQETLVDFTLTSSDIWALWLDESNATVVKYISFEHNTAAQWNQVFVQPPPEEEIHIGVDLDPRVRPVQTSNQCLMDPEAGRDVLQLVQCLRLISDAVSAEMAYEMEKALEYLQAPERAAELVLENLLCNDSDNVIVDVQNKLQDVRNPTAAMMVLLREMDLETDSEVSADGLVAPGQSLNVRIGLSQLYSGSAAVSVVSQAVCHVAMTRALFCRDLLILQKLYLRFGDNVFLGGGAQLLQLQQDLIPRTSQLLSSYHLLKHVSQSLASSVPISTIDANLQHLTVLELSDTPTMTSGRSALNPQTVVELFYQTAARRLIVSQLFSNQQGGALFDPCMFQIQWKTNRCSEYSFIDEKLCNRCPRVVPLQEYVRLIGPWCQVNIASCRFMLAQCYLANGEGQKALRCFQEAATEVEKEEFLMRLTGGEDEDAAVAPATPRLQYYNKVLRLLEDVGLPELVIQLATLAITEAVGDVSSQAALWTRIFKHHLDLGHNSEAYDALTQNPDGSMQLDCLRQLVVVLCERSQLQDLVNFPYVNLHDEVVSIIESRARGLDLLTHNYYELLYAFHIARHNYPGTVMFEFGMRLGREVRTRLGLQKQVNCYLAALNCLRLIRPEYAWIVQPVSGATYERPGASPKRNSDGEFPAEPVKRQVDILEVRDLEKEYILSRSRLTLAQHHPPSAAIAGTLMRTHVYLYPCGDISLT
uniref:Nucleoporin 160 n=1 Tax=Neolamprologus brichardi TaxID=32507 RepID=A0A3Q4I347_NEOBR